MDVVDKKMKKYQKLNRFRVSLRILYDKAD